MTTTQTTTALPTVKPFKSGRAAKLAMTKAESAYKDALSARSSKFSELSTRPDYDAWSQELKAADATLEAARLLGNAVYAQAQAQSFYVKTWYFGNNPTRDLIRDNMD